MNTPSLSESVRSLEADSRASIVRVVRKICLLREQRDAPEAANLEKTDLANAVRDFRLARGPDALPESELREMFAAEERRVAEAVILSELLIPQLVKSFPAGSNLAPRAQPASQPLPSRLTEPARQPNEGVPQIADLLDGMLASERGKRRQRTGS